MQAYHHPHVSAQKLLRDLAQRRSCAPLTNLREQVMHVHGLGMYSDGVSHTGAYSILG